MFWGVCRRMIEGNDYKLWQSGWWSPQQRHHIWRVPGMHQTEEEQTLKVYKVGRQYLERNYFDFEVNKMKNFRYFGYPSYAVIINKRKTSICVKISNMTPRRDGVCVFVTSEVRRASANDWRVTFLLMWTSNSNSIFVILRSHFPSTVWVSAVISAVKTKQSTVNS